MKKINEIYWYWTEEYSTTATNNFNSYPKKIPDWLMDWILEEAVWLFNRQSEASSHGF